MHVYRRYHQRLNDIKMIQNSVHKTTSYYDLYGVDISVIDILKCMFVNVCACVLLWLFVDC